MNTPGPTSFRCVLATLLLAAFAPGFEVFLEEEEGLLTCGHGSWVKAMSLYFRIEKQHLDRNSFFEIFNPLTCCLPGISTSPASMCATFSKSFGGQTDFLQCTRIESESESEEAFATSSSRVRVAPQVNRNMPACNVGLCWFFTFYPLLGKHQSFARLRDGAATGRDEDALIHRSAEKLCAWVSESIALHG